MRIVRFDKNGQPCHGIIEDETIHEVDGGLFDGLKKTGITHSLSATKLLIPLKPEVFYAAGLNYAEHVKEQAEMHGREPKFQARYGISC